MTLTKSSKTERLGPGYYVVIKDSWARRWGRPKAWGCVYSAAKLLDEEGSVNRDPENGTRVVEKSGQALCMRELCETTMYAYCELGSFWEILGTGWEAGKWILATSSESSAKGTRSLSPERIAGFQVDMLWDKWKLNSVGKHDKGLMITD